MAGKRVADLQTGDLTQHAGGSCGGLGVPPYNGCPDPHSPWRVEKLEQFRDDGIDVTWSHPACGAVARPLPCSTDCLVEYFGSNQ